MDFREKIILLSYGAIFSGIVTAYFGFYLYSIPALSGGKILFLLPAVFMIIIWGLVVLRIYYWTQFLKEWIYRGHNNLRFWI